MAALGRRLSPSQRAHQLFVSTFAFFLFLIVFHFNFSNLRVNAMRVTPLLFGVRYWLPQRQAVTNYIGFMWFCLLAQVLALMLLSSGTSGEFVISTIRAVLYCRTAFVRRPSQICPMSVISNVVCVELLENRLCSGLCWHRCFTEMSFAVSCQGMDLMSLLGFFSNPWKWT